MTTERKPKVSIGLPVFNAERYLWLALESLLGQDYGNFELIISDNASTDATVEICHNYMSRDNRIRFYRNERNLGAARNFNLVLELSTGEYFMWAAHDDVWDPSYVRKCVAKLEEHPGAVLSYSGIRFIDENGGDRNIVYSDIQTLGMDIPERVHMLLTSDNCCPIYGVIRRKALMKTRLLTGLFGLDVILMLELLLLGDFVKVPEQLFYYRFPTQGKTLLDYMALINPAKDNPSKTPFSDLARELLRVINNSNLDKSTKFEILADFVEVMSFYNLGWRGALLRENLNTLEPIADPQQMREFVLRVLTST